MGRNPHKDYHYQINKDLTYKKIPSFSEHEGKDEILFFVKTEFDKNYGDYTYSRHFVYNIDVKRVNLFYGDIYSDRSYFAERLNRSFYATIDINIIDVEKKFNSFEFYHRNGLGFGYSDINGLGIESIIDSLKLMKVLDEWKTWEVLFRVIEIHRNIAAKMYHFLPDGTGIVSKILDNKEFNKLYENNSFLSGIRQDYLNGKYKDIGLDPELRKLTDKITLSSD